MVYAFFRWYAFVPAYCKTLHSSLVLSEKKQKTAAKPTNQRCRVFLPTDNLKRGVNNQIESTTRPQNKPNRKQENKPKTPKKRRTPRTNNNKQKKFKQKRKNKTKIRQTKHRCHPPRLCHLSPAGVDPPRADYAGGAFQEG